MNTRIATVALLTAISQVALADGISPISSDSGFQNMLNHEAYAGPTAVTVARGELDAGERLVHAMLRGERHLMLADRYDPSLPIIASAFDRMLEHAPYAGPTAVTVTREQDRRVDELVIALRQGRVPAGTLIASH
ncbi:MAG: hypothetical protein NFCOHLIN_03141 [Gammaproteobacteria bacterium]|nr:hypothetical protein [Gammaproteobacteria bacterium]